MDPRRDNDRIKFVKILTFTPSADSGNLFKLNIIYKHNYQIINDRAKLNPKLAELEINNAGGFSL